MCGINGFIQFNRIKDSAEMRNIVHGMNEKIIHRGPDAEGLFADELCSLGMRRLSIIDLQNGNQPVWNENHDMVIIFNGELYNFKLLREELKALGHDFRTNSDTEVVLHGIESFGPSFLEKMEGMYAFAVYDLKKKRWMLARDRVGEKPLYYYRTRDNFLFGSELKSLLATGLVPKEIDRDALSMYFQLTYIPAPYSIIKNIYKLPQASYMLIDSNGSVTKEKYWDIENIESEQLITDYTEGKKLLKDALYKSVEQRMISDVPLGAFLSGGFDSTIIVGIMAQISAKPVDTFTIGYKERLFDESSLAKIVAERNHTNHHMLIMDWESVLNDLDILLENIDEPFADSSLIATYAVSKLAKKYVTVALTGDSGDELFAGYNKYLISYYGNRYKRVPRFLRKSVVEPLVRLIPVSNPLAMKAHKVINAANLDSYEQRKYMMSLGFKPNEITELMEDGYVSSMQFLREYYNRLTNYDEQTRAQYVDLKVVLEGDMLPKVDRASMLASLETRVPMLDSKVIELAYRLPSTFKINKTNRKIILKDTFRDLIPEELFQAPKHGFGVPIGKWLETTLRERLLKYADSEYLESQGLFNADYINNIVKEHMTHTTDRYSELWAFFVFQNWYERIMYN